MKEFRYSLDKSTPRKKFTCPKCGHKKKYVRYVDNETGEFAPEEFGRCDRENNCGYWVSPDGNKPMDITKNNPIPELPISYPNGSATKFLKQIDSNFHKFCISIGITEEHLREMLVGTDRTYTVFGLMDSKQKLLNAKKIEYGENGKRNKDEGARVFHLSAPSGFKYSRCFYGLHMLDEDLETIIVESEKSAVIAKYFYPKYNWIASGGSQGGTASMVKDIEDLKSVVYLCDSDLSGRNNKTIKNLSSNPALKGKIIISDPFNGHEDGFDIADYIIKILQNGGEITGDLETDISYKRRKMPVQPSGTEFITLDELSRKFPFLRANKKFFKQTKKEKEEGIARYEVNWDINPVEFFKWAYESLGFYTYMQGEDMMIVREENNVVSSFTYEQLKEYIYHHLDPYPTVQEMVVKSRKGIISKESLPFFKHSRDSLKIFRDPRNSSYVFFKNGFIQVTKDKIGELTKYKDIEFKIWNTDIIDRDYKKSEYKNNDFYRFCQNITNQDPERLRFLMTSIGYYMHTFKDPSLAKAIVPVDEGSNPDQANGGTGKTLLSKAVAQMRECVTEDGKRIGRSNDKFIYQKVKHSTKVLVIDDCSKNFPWDKFFSVITTAIPVEKKGMTAFNIDFPDAAKLWPNTNYMVQANDESTKRRYIELEIYPKYSSKHTPRDDFGRNFFSDEWGDNDWHGFHAFMLECTKMYLKYGICQTSTESAPMSKLMASTCVDFAEYSRGYFKTDVKYRLNDEAEAFRMAYPDFMEGRNRLTERRFASWMRSYASIKGLDYEKGRSDYAFDEMKTGKYTWFVLTKREDENDENQNLDA